MRRGYARGGSTGLRWWPVQVLVWFVCIGVACMYVVPIHQGIERGNTILRILLFLPPPKAYVSASHTLEMGHVITKRDLTWHQIDGFEAEGLFQERELLIGQTVQERILRGDLIREERLRVSKSPGLAAIVPEGYRAVSIHLTDSDRVGGFVEPGDHVDVLVSLVTEHEPLQTFTILEDIKILSVDDHLSSVPVGQWGLKPQVALMTTPRQASRLIHAMRHGKPRLVLRAEGDDHRRLPPLTDDEEDDWTASDPSRVRKRLSAQRRRRQVAQVRSTFGLDLMPDRQTYEEVKALMIRDGILLPDDPDLGGESDGDGI